MVWICPRCKFPTDEPPVKSKRFAWRDICVYCREAEDNFDFWVENLKEIDFPLSQYNLWFERSWMEEET